MIEELLSSKEEFLSKYKIGITLKCDRMCSKCNTKVRKITSVYEIGYNEVGIEINCINCKNTTYDERNSYYKLLKDLKSIYEFVSKFIVI